MFPKYEWTVVMEHGANAFRKTKRVVAVNYLDAARFALTALASDRDDSDAFCVIGVTRGRSV